MSEPDLRIARERAWAALQPHWQRLREQAIARQFELDSQRAQRFSAGACGLYLDYSKQNLDPPALDALLGLADSAGLQERRTAMFQGQHINVTEDRAVWHVMLRRPVDAVPAGAVAREAHTSVHRVLAQMRAFSEAVRTGAHLGYSGEPIEDVVNIGIGGSDLGPAMACRALAELNPDGPRVHFVSNIDATQLNRVLARCDPARTLFIVASKTFSTLETLSNATTAREWLVRAAGSSDAVARHFVALSTARERCAEFGIPVANMFEFWDWVGGRFSVWSAIGLSIACAVGMPAFEAFLAGGHEMDRHFLEAEASRNLPVLLAVTGLWNRNLAGIATHAVLCYDYALELFPAFLQQMEMESNGKSVDLQGQPVRRDSVPVIWGGLGNNAQHAFYQLLHQGTDRVSCDFIVAAKSLRPSPGHESATLANALAQAAVMMTGRTPESVADELAQEGLSGSAMAAAVAHRQMAGNRPSSFLLYERMTPRLLGALVALYEHKVFVQSLCWNVNAFDQFGVELGKRIAADIQQLIDDDGDAARLDPSTQSLLSRARALLRVGGGET
jgi:glucose-6-phosphate isomerase